MRFQYKHIVAIIYTVVLFLDRLDLTIVNITLPTLAKDFHVPITSTDWVSMSFLLALAISIPISCWLGERFGFKKIYIISMILFGMGSTLCAWAPNLDSLIVLRFIHGIGGGMLIPVGMTILYRIYDKSEYASITSFTFLPSLIAPSIAPFLGGVLLDTWGWQTVFLFSGPICLILVITSIFLLHDDNKHESPQHLDWFGFILFSVSLLDIFYTLSLIGKTRESSSIILGLMVLTLLIFAFIKCEKKAKFPLINLQYFKDEIFIKANLLQFCFQICHFGAIFLIGMYLQIGIGMSASMAGLIMGMQGVGAIVTSRYSVKLFNQYGPKLPLTIGLAGIAILTPCILLIRSPEIVWFPLVLFFLRGVFSGFCGTPIQTLSVIDFDKGQIGAINTIFNACRQVSISFGVAISSGLMITGMSLAKLNEIYSISPGNIIKVFGPGFLAIPIIALAGIIIAQSLKKVFNISE
jgi:EmrB/QacA subfamily drug resistance transporter